MTETNIGEIVAKRDVLATLEANILTGLEQWLQGNTPDAILVRTPFIPRGVVARGDIKAINESRRSKIWFPSIVVGVILGMDIARQVPLLTLGDMDLKSGKVEALPKLYGIYDKESEEIRTEQKVLAPYPLTDEMIQELLSDCQRSAA